jgi:hypothetical protein
VSALDGFFVLGSHTYARRGEYTVAIRVVWPGASVTQTLYATVLVK